MLDGGADADAKPPKKKKKQSAGALAEASPAVTPAVISAPLEAASPGAITVTKKKGKKGSKVVAEAEIATPAPSAAGTGKKTKKKKIRVAVEDV